MIISWRIDWIFISDIFPRSAISLARNSGFLVNIVTLFATNGRRTRAPRNQCISSKFPALNRQLAARIGAYARSRLYAEKQFRNRGVLTIFCRVTCTHARTHAHTHARTHVLHFAICSQCEWYERSQRKGTANRARRSDSIELNLSRYTRIIKKSNAR